MGLVEALYAGRRCLFRIFLKKRLYSSSEQQDLSKEIKRLSSPHRNRRTYDRFAVDQQHLTVMNEQDILLLRDISAKGFASEVSERAFDRFEISDIYAARMRYHGEVYDIDVRVAWKKDQLVGFELHNPDRRVLEFFQSMLRPIQLAQSLTQVDAAFMRDQHAGMIWFHGESVDLHLWQSEDEGLSAWRLVADEQVIEWSSVHGIKTGIVQNHSSTGLGILEPGQTHREIDAEPDPERLRFAADVIAALPFSERSELAKTIDESLIS